MRQSEEKTETEKEKIKAWCVFPCKRQNILFGNLIHGAVNHYNSDGVQKNSGHEACIE